MVSYKKFDDLFKNYSIFEEVNDWEILETNKLGICLIKNLASGRILSVDKKELTGG